MTTTAAAAAQMELSFGEPAVPEVPGTDGAPSSEPGDFSGEMLTALEEARDHCGYKSWREAWHAHCGGHRRDPDERVVRGAAGLLMLAALCAEDPLAENSILCWLAEIGAAFAAEMELTELAAGEAP